MPGEFVWLFTLETTSEASEERWAGSPVWRRSAVAKRWLCAQEVREAMGHSWRLQHHHLVLAHHQLAMPARLGRSWPRCSQPLLPTWRLKGRFTSNLPTLQILPEPPGTQPLWWLRRDRQLLRVSSHPKRQKLPANWNERLVPAVYSLELSALWPHWLL